MHHQSHMRSIFNEYTIFLVGLCCALYRALSHARHALPNGRNTYTKDRHAQQHCSNMPADDWPTETIQTLHAQHCFHVTIRMHGHRRRLIRNSIRARHRAHDAHISASDQMSFFLLLLGSTPDTSKTTIFPVVDKLSIMT